MLLENRPLDNASAGLSSNLTCRQSICPTISCIVATRFATYVLSRCGDVLNQCKTIVESHQNITLLGTIFNALLVSRYNWASNNAPQSSSRGIVTVFNGAIRDLTHNSLTYSHLSRLNVYTSSRRS